MGVFTMREFTSFLLCGAVTLALALPLSGCGGSEPTAAPTVTNASTEAASSAPAASAAPDNSGDEFVGAYAAFAVTTNSLKDGYWDEITANTVAGQNLSPDLSWEPVEGASCYAVYMVDINTHYFLHWVQGDITETSLPQGFAGSKYYIGMYPPPGDTHVYNIYVIALKNPVERVKGSVNGISPKFPDFINALDTDKDGNTGNIISVGKVSGKFIGK